MEKLFISFKRLSFALMVGGALAVGASSCSKGEEAGAVNVEEGEFKSKDPTDHNATGNDDKMQQQPADPSDDSTYENIYDRQEKKAREGAGSGVGGAANVPQKTTN
ncbi:hypothetical protein [Rufibacter roseus]|uniref:Lipoprotein n=1 Tax=Rufibacter roseus TaxID=1567108 RepID=A0ABW2DK73_9BACT|nr:hypothetical protein [Rufibacter roseus]